MFSRAKRKEMAMLEFEPVEHRYTKSGIIIPGVTSIIEPYLPYAGLPEDVRQRALTRGTTVHALTEMWDCGELDDDTLEDVVQSGYDGFVEAWGKFIKQYQPDITDIEVKCYHTLYRYAGTADRICYIDGVRTLLEIKTGGLIPEYAWQTAAYRLALNEQSTLPPIEKRLAICLRENGTFLCVEHDDPTDEQAFIGALNIYNWRLKKRGTRRG